VLRRLTTLKSERSTWVPTWMDIADYIQPRRGRFFVEDKNKGERKDQNDHQQPAHAREPHPRVGPDGRAHQSGAPVVPAHPARP
jgi:hypothetical protein